MHTFAGASHTTAHELHIVAHAVLTAGCARIAITYDRAEREDGRVRKHERPGTSYGLHTKTPALDCFALARREWLVPYEWCVESIFSYVGRCGGSLSELGESQTNEKLL